MVSVYGVSAVDFSPSGTPPTGARRNRPSATPAGIALLFAFLSMVFPSTAFGQGNPIPEEAAVAFLEAHWARVEQVLRSRDELAPNPIARLLLGHAVLARNGNNEAYVLFSSVLDDSDHQDYLQFCKRLRERAPQSVWAWYLLADALARTGDSDGARSAFDNAVGSKSTSALPLVARGEFLASLGELDRALVDLTRATELEPQSAEAWLGLGVVSIRLGALDGAERALSRSVAINDRLALAHLAMAVVAHGNGDWQRSFSEMDEFRAMAPSLKTLADYNEVVLVTALEQVRSENQARSPAGAPTRASIEPGIKPTVVIARLPQGTKPSARFGPNLPPLREYFEPPATPQLAMPATRRVVHDRIVVHPDHARLVDLFNEGVGLIGTVQPNSQRPSGLGPIDSLRQQNDGSVPAPYSAVRMTVMSDGTWVLRGLDRRSGAWTPLPRAEAIDYLHNEMSYGERLGAAQDTSYQQAFQAVSQHRWQPVFAEFQNLRVSDLVSMSSETPISVTYRGESYQMTAGSFLEGNISRLPAALARERSESRQFDRLAKPSPAWAKLFQQPVPSRPRSRVPEFFAGVAHASPVGSHGNAIPSQGRPPGGVSTWELGQAWVNRGDSPLKTVFTLGYETLSEPAESQ